MGKKASESETNQKYKYRQNARYTAYEIQCEWGSGGGGENNKTS